MAARTVDTNDYDNPPFVSMGDSVFLYQAYAGRDTITDSTPAPVFIDDHVINNGGPFIGLVGDRYRSWFDGISYARVETPAPVIRSKGGHSQVPILLLQQIPSRSLLKVTISIKRNENATLQFFDLYGRIIQSYIFPTYSRGTFTKTISTDRLTTGIYLCRFTNGRTTIAQSVKIMR